MSQGPSTGSLPVRLGAGPPRVRQFLARHAASVVVVGAVAYVVGCLFVLKLSVLLTAALAFSAIAATVILMRPTVGFFVLVATFSAEHTLVLTDFFTPVKLLGGLVFAAWALSALVDRRYRLPRSPVLVFVPMLVVSALLSVSVASNLDSAAVRMNTWAQLGLLVFLVATILRDHKDLERLAWILLLSTMLSSVYGVYEVTQLGVTELSGLMENRNNIALFLAMCIPFLVYFFQRTQTMLGKFLLAAMAMLFVLAEALSFARGGFIVMVAGLLLSLFLVARVHRFRLAFTLVAVVVTAILFIPGDYWDRVGTIVPAIQEGADTMGLRYDLWRSSARVIRDHPVLGVGPGNYMDVFMRYGGIIGLRRSPLITHNAYLSLTVELGLLGGSIFLAIVVSSLVGYYRNVRRARRHGLDDLADLAMAFGIALLLFCIYGMKGSLEYFKYLWMLVGLSPAIQGILDRTLAEKEVAEQ